MQRIERGGATLVSTHSRPKAAASVLVLSVALRVGFNTQPPEGGCFAALDFRDGGGGVSTHSRPKAAASSGGRRG